MMPYVSLMLPRRPARLFSGLVLALLSAGCAVQRPMPAPVTTADDTQARYAAASSALESGVSLYQDGRFDAARTALREALSTGLPTPDAAVSAHKHLAFIDCAQGKAGQCREEFRAALRIDPGFVLSRGEAGHPMWGPVFTEVRKEIAPGAR